MGKTYFAAVVVGAVVEQHIADKFAEKCAPHKPDDVIEGFINSVVSGDIEVHLTETPPEGR